MNLAEMTAEESVALGRRAMACEGWAWPEQGVYIDEHGKRHGYAQARCVDEECRYGFMLYPDLRDPGMRGHCLEMMRKAVNHASASTEANAFGDGGGWRVTAKREIWLAAETEAEAIINAWERRSYRGEG